MMSRVAALIAVSTLLATGCGGSSFIALDVSGDCAGTLCEIPAAVDGVTVRTFAADDLTAPILEESIALTTQSFPVLIVLEPGDATPATLTEQVILTLNGSEVASGAVEHGWEEGKTNRVQIVVEVAQ